MKHKEEFITEEKVINTPAGGVLIGKDKDGQTIIPNDGSLGGFLIGRTHKQGGIKAINKGTGQPLEMQVNEIVITAPAVADTTKREFEGKMMTNREILSKINSDGGGVSFADGGDIPAKIHTTDKEYEYGGKMVNDTDIAHSLGMNSTLKKGKQQFSSGDTTYDVDAIYNAIKKGKLHLKTKEVETFPMMYPVYDKKYSETVKTDFRKPNGIIVRTEIGEEVLIDGNHRMNNAYLKGRKTIKTYYIEDPKQIAKFTKKKKFESGGENKVGGHLSSGKSLKQIAEMHNVSLTHINEELAKGLEVEKEHFADFKERTRVAKDHLVENPNYYTILKTAGLEGGGVLNDLELQQIANEKFSEGYGKVKYFEITPFGGTWSYLRNPNFSTRQTYKMPTFVIDSTQEQKDKARETKEKYENSQPKGINILEFSKKFANENNGKIYHKSKSGSVYVKINDNTIRISDHNILDRDFMNPKERYDLEIIQKYFDEKTPTNLSYWTKEFKMGGKVGKEDLVKDSKSGNTPARDLNNYNDVMDLEADGAVGGDSGLAFSKGGLVTKDNLKSIEKEFLALTDNSHYKGIYDEDEIDYGVALEWGKYGYSVSEEQQSEDYQMLINASAKFNAKNIGKLYANAEFGDKYNTVTILDYDMLANDSQLVSRLPEKYFAKLKVGRGNNRNVVERLELEVKKYKDLEAVSDISKKIGVTEEKAKEIVESLNYSKEYYEKNKNQRQSRFDVFNTRNFPRKDFENLEQTLDYIQSDAFANSVYNSAGYGNPISEGVVHLYGWSALRIKYKINDFPFKPDGSTDFYKDRTTTLSIYPYVAVNISGKQDFMTSFKKGISDFIWCYKYYVLGTENKKKIEEVDDLSELLEMVKSGNYAKGGVVYNPKNPKIEKVTIKDTKYNTVSVIGRNASNVSGFEYLLKAYLFYSSEEEDWIRFYVNDNTRGSYEINLNRGKKNTVKNINPDAINSANIKRVIDANTYLVRNYDWTDFFQLGSTTSASNNQYPEYYEFIGKSSQSFTKGKIYKAEYPEDLEIRANFIDDTGILNGFSGSNYEKFKPSTKEVYLTQQSFTSKTPINSAKTLTKYDFLDTKIWIGDDLVLRDKVIEKLEQMGIPIDESVGNRTFSKDVFILVFSGYFVVLSESKETFYTIYGSKKEIFPKDLGIDIATINTPKTLTKDELERSKIWIGDDISLRDKVKQKLREIGFDFDVDNGKFNADKDVSIYVYTDDFVIYNEPKEEFDEQQSRKEIYLEDLGIYNVYQTTNSPTSAAKVEKSAVSSVYSLDLAISKLEKASSEVVKKYNTEIYEKSLKFLYDTKSTYELALKFTPESAFVYERLDLMKKLADIQKEIKKIEDMKQGGTYFMLAKIFDKLERGENWKTIEQTQDVITNQIPQSEIEVIIRSQKFKNWFGDWEKALINDEYDNVSKAFTDGKPSVYHHGARRIKYTYREVSNGVLYLAENISYALWFSQNSTAQSEEGNYLTECFVNIKNPIDLTAFYVNQVDLGDIVRYIDAIYPLANIYDFIPSNIALLIKTNQPTNLTMWAWQLIRKNVKFVNHIKENTPYDGFLYYENNPSDQVLNTITGEYEENVTKAVAIFKSHQVKVVDAVLFDGGLDDWRFENGGKLNN